ncbi:hypothetical protein SAMN05421758_10765 [Salimicrobium salexigens]|uniref:Uncharacterized protein n=1 Tax=Salimicrobium salexigens TaxID=908941 RepID=A0ABY1KVZ8_9BACI|nr:hypothetical protein SAMN05421758_10765 [Salimicrobium salexigens]
MTYSLIKQTRFIYFHEMVPVKQSAFKNSWNAGE